MNTSKFSLDKLSYVILFITVFLIPIFFIPSAAVPQDAGKTALLSIGALLALSLFLVKTVKVGEFQFPAHRIMWAVLLIPAAFFLSSILSSNPGHSLFGYNLEIGTWGFITIGFALLLLSSLFFNTRERILYAYTATFIGFALLAIFTLVKIFFGDIWIFPGGLSPMGGWMDAGAFFGAASLVILLSIEEMTLSRRARLVLTASYVVSLFILAVTNVRSVWLLLGIFSLGYLLYGFSRTGDIPPTTNDQRPTTERKISIGALALLLLSLLFYINPVVSSRGAGISEFLATKFEVTNIMVSPTARATYEVARPALKESPLLGSGPNTFDSAWLAHKPQAVNETVFWNTAFPYGFGFLPTLLATTGLLGAILWLVFFALYIRLGVRALFARENSFIISSAFLFSLFLWSSFLFYAPSKSVLALAFIYTGLFLAGTTISGVTDRRVIRFRQNPALAFLSLLILVVVLLGNAALLYGIGKRAVASVYFQQAALSANDGNIDVAREKSIRAINLSGQDIYYNGLSQISVARTNSVINSQAGTEAERQAAFQESLSESIAAAQAAVRARPENYANWIALGALYESLVPSPLSVEGAYESAKDAYETARTKNPRSPEPDYLLARLEVARGESAAAREYLSRALDLKNDYAAGYLLLTQIEASENNVAAAIKSAETLTLLEPTNAGLHFQLGLLKHSAADHEGALGSLSNALRLSPDYANAKYFYGLTLDKLGRRDEALLIFRDLAQANPEVEELKRIIANLEAGKDALAGFPSSEEPLTRPNPPISR